MVEKTNLAADDSGKSVPLMGLRPAGGWKVDIEATAKRSDPLPQGIRTGAFVGVRPTVNCYIETGDATVMANTTSSHFFRADEYREFYAPRGRPYISVIRAGGDDGTLYISVLDGAI